MVVSGMGVVAMDDALVVMIKAYTRYLERTYRKRGWGNLGMRATPLNVLAEQIQTTRDCTAYMYNMHSSLEAPLGLKQFKPPVTNPPPQLRAYRSTHR